MKTLLKILLSPITLVLWLIGLLVAIAVKLIALTGRGLAFVLGLLLISVGVMFSLTGLGAIIGVPLSIIGTILIVKIAF